MCRQARCTTHCSLACMTRQSVAINGDTTLAARFKCCAAKHADRELSSPRVCLPARHHIRHERGHLMLRCRLPSVPHSRVVVKAKASAPGSGNRHIRPGKLAEAPDIHHLLTSVGCTWSPRDVQVGATSTALPACTLACAWAQTQSHTSLHHLAKLEVSAAILLAWYDAVTLTVM